MPKTFRGYVPSTIPSFVLESPDGLEKLEVRCKPFVPGSYFLDFLSEIKSENASTMAFAVYQILQAAVSDEQWDEFKAFIDDPKNGYSVESLAEIGGYLGEIYANRPTEPSSP